jgi:D-3-phosphoglycerate dehydrogenase / 2-oxoglutarate reductase
MNNKIKILACAPLEDDSKKRLMDLGELTFAGWGGPEGMHATPLTPAELIDLGKDADVIILGTEPMPAEVLQKLPALKLLVCSRAGVESIDIRAASSLGIPVLNTPGRNAFAVADYTIGLLIALVRKIPSSQTFLQSGLWKTWSSPSDHGLEGRELPGRTLGLIGLGMIGRLVARRAVSFDMRLLGYDPYVNDEQVIGLGIQMTSLDELLEGSDFISLHCSLTPETRNMLNSENLEKIKPNAYIINTARAALIEEEALMQALQNRKIAGAALDVFWKEPLPQNHPILKLGNVIMTPHIAGMGDQVFSRGSKMILEGILSFFSNKKPANLVNPEVLKPSFG